MKNYTIFAPARLGYTLFSSCGCQTCTPSHAHFDNNVKSGTWSWFERYDNLNNFSSKAINLLEDFYYKDFIAAK